MVQPPTAHWTRRRALSKEPLRQIAYGPPAVSARSFRKMNTEHAKALRRAPLSTPTSLPEDAVRDVSGALNATLADIFALYLKTKSFHWHMSGPRFRDYHLVLDEQAQEIIAATDPVAERVRKIGGLSLRSIGHIARLQRIADNDAEFVTAQDM